ncbi:hypothetical protein N6H14_14885 [Paenibacillus sp. CC-CFT747]|nr:hypothetical protein N6H14_14885 [Paenibacillus sp. CC-CFT747]
MITADISEFKNTYSGLNGTNVQINISKLDLIRCVMTVGHKDFYSFKQAGLIRIAELFFKALGNLEYEDEYLRLSERFWGLEQSEMVPVSYHLGQGLTKALAEKLLAIRWLIHLKKFDGKVSLHNKGTINSKIKLYNCTKKVDSS